MVDKNKIIEEMKVKLEVGKGREILLKLWLGIWRKI